MKILLLVKRFQFGGAENHVCELANALAERGHQVWLLSGPGFQIRRLHPAVRHQVVLFSDFKLFVHLFKLVQLIRREQIELIHSHQRFPVFLGTLAAKWCRIPVVATVHGSPLTDLKTRFVRESLSKVITIRESCFEKLKDYPSFVSKIVLIPNGINLPVLPVARKVKHQGISLFYISRLDQHHAKLLKFFLADVWPQIILQYPDSILHVVGDGTGFKRIKRYWKAGKFSGFHATVFFEGYCCNVPALYPKADLVMGVGRVAIESLVYGVPLLSVKYNHLGPIVTRENLKRMQYANFVDLEAVPPDRMGLMEKLLDFISNREQYENEALVLQQIVRQEYNLNLIVEKIVDVYQQVI